MSFFNFPFDFPHNPRHASMDYASQRVRAVDSNIEDVQFEDVTEDKTHKKPEIDKDARARQLVDAVDERVKSLAEKSPHSALLVSAMFVMGADWADEHPLSDFADRSAWICAQRNEVKRILSEAPISKTPDILFEMLTFVTFADGASWANEHPAPTL